MRQTAWIFLLLIASVLVSSCIVVVPPPENVITVILKQGAEYLGTEDTGLNSGSPTTSYGTSPALFVGRRAASLWRSIIRFDVSHLAGKTVKGASLRFLHYAHNDQSVDTTIGLYQISAGNADWTAGTQEYGTEVGKACWAQMKHDQTDWVGEAGLLVPGLDYATTVLDEKVAYKDQPGWLEFSLPKEVIQSWIDNGGTNSGLLLVCRDEDTVGAVAALRSANAYSGHERPELVITYVD